MPTPLLPRQPTQAGDVALDAVVLGDGPLTVVFANGMGSPLEEWALVAPTVAQSCRVVCYDRRPAPPGGPLPTHDAAQMAADLRHLLDALRVTGPLVLVGHSWGGVVVRRFAVDHADDVAGMVFVDATHENIKGMVPTRATTALYGFSQLFLQVGLIRRRLLRSLGFGRLGPVESTIVDNLPWPAMSRTSRAEYGGTGPSCQELARIAPDLPHVPTRILLAGGRGLTAKLGAKQLAGIRTVWQSAAAGVSEATVQSVPDSGHYIPLDQPQAVIDAIDDVVSRVSVA